MQFELIESEIVYPGRAFTVRRDHLRLPDGRTTRFDIVEHHSSVVIVPLDRDGNLVFVRQYRHAAGLDLLELPAGVIEPGEEPEACARREVREEIGLAAGRMEAVGGFYLAPGYSTEYMHVYLATGLEPGPLKADPDEFLQVEPIPLAQALSLADGGKIPDSKSLAALLLARKRLSELV
ncbi:MAG: NUDIX hydrolase [Chloroflexi bacterium]|nr:NUDIX hydrolase [Chloroflexota bacterium]